MQEFHSAHPLSRAAIAALHSHITHVVLAPGRERASMAQAGAHDEGAEHSRSMPSPYVSLVDRQAGAHGGKPPKAEGATAASSLRGNGAGAQQTGQGGNDKLLMKRTLVAQSKKIQQLTAKIDGMESEREAMAQQVRNCGGVMQPTVVVAVGLLLQRYVSPC